ncbi:MAG: hypothetical protein LUD82_06495 [Clostridiales bacterium]|nr:hypothetical protein [Clostridiales bacterium]
MGGVIFPPENGSQQKQPFHQDGADDGGLAAGQEGEEHQNREDQEPLPALAAGKH